MEVERVRLCIEEPLAGGVEFLEDVLDEADLLVDGSAPVVLPTALQGHGALSVLAGDAPGEAPPEGGMHGVKIAARRIGPARHAIDRDRVLGEPVEVLR
jgi:hypothetical protein